MDALVVGFVSRLAPTFRRPGPSFGQQSFFQLWSAGLFPTLLRGTAQGLMFAVVRIGLGLWSFFVPLLTATGFAELAWILTGFVAVSSLIGFLGAPGMRANRWRRSRCSGSARARRG